VWRGNPGAAVALFASGTVSVLTKDGIRQRTPKLRPLLLMRRTTSELGYQNQRSRSRPRPRRSRLLEDRNFLDAIDALAADSIGGKEGQVCGLPWTVI
jgi:hypothetical protein